MTTMTQKTKLLLTLLLCMMSVSGFASNPDDGDNMYVLTKGSNQVNTYSLDNLEKLTFGNTSMSVWYNAGKKDYTYSDISLVTFLNTMLPTGVEQLTSFDSDVQIIYDRDTQTLSFKSSKKLSIVTVIDLQGRLMCKANIGSDASVFLSTLPHGIYVVRVEGTSIGKSVKIIK